MIFKICMSIFFYHFKSIFKQVSDLTFYLNSCNWRVKKYPFYVFGNEEIVTRKSIPQDEVGAFLFVDGSKLIIQK